MSKSKKIIISTILFFTVTIAIVGLSLYLSLSAGLPDIYSVEDYEPNLVSEVYARGGEKIGEFYTDEIRKLVPIDEIPDLLKGAFMAAEDSSFYDHSGFNYLGIIRAIITNFTSGKRSQGASTITQQTARSLFLNSERTYTRKLKEAIMARRMESRLSKDEILYLYLNQVYFGRKAYGVGSAAETFFRKTVQDLTLAEMAMLAGLLTAPSKYNPVRQPKRAKIRQNYVLKRMLETGRITQDQFDIASEETLTIYRRKVYKDVAPYFVETIRLLLIEELGEELVEKKGLKIRSSLDFEAQKAAQASVRKGLRELDKRQGYKGPKGHIDIQDEEALQTYLKGVRDQKIDRNVATFSLFPDGSTDKVDEFEFFQKKDDQGKVISNIPPYLSKDEIIEGVVTKISDSHGYAMVRFAESQGLLPLSEMTWARTRDTKKRLAPYLEVKRISKVLKVGDLIDVKILGKTAKGISLKKKSQLNLTEYASLSLEQEPEAQSALLSYDLKTEEIIAMVGGSDFRKTKLNRTYQSRRQTGSSIKPIIYAAGLESGLTPASPISGAPVIYNKSDVDLSLEEQKELLESKPSSESSVNAAKVWKPKNYGGKFFGDMLLRNCLKRSQNTSTLRVMETVGIDFALKFARRMGIFSPLNKDFSMALGSSGVTLYEMTKVFSVFARNGRNIRPVIVHEVTGHKGDSLAQSLTFDIHFAEKIDELVKEFAKLKLEYGSRVGTDPSPITSFFHSDPDQLIAPETAYIISSILHAATTEEGGTGLKAQKLGRKVAGKTGTTDGSYDAWFMGYTAQIVSGVWVGFDQEKSMGPGETGGKAALPIWLDYMMGAHKDLPQKDFAVPPGIVFVNLDNKTGKVASPDAEVVVRQAFKEGTEPGRGTAEEIEQQEEEERADFLRKDF